MYTNRMYLVTVCRVNRLLDELITITRYGWMMCVNQSNALMCLQDVFTRRCGGEAGMF